MLFRRLGAMHTISDLKKRRISPEYETIKLGIIGKLIPVLFTAIVVKAFSHSDAIGGIYLF